MTNGVDGSIRIDARIDVSNLSRDIRRVDQTLDGVAGVAEEVSDAIAQTGETAGQALAQEVAQGAEEAGNRLQDLTDRVDTLQIKFGDLVGATKGLVFSSLGLSASAGAVIGAGVKTADEIRQAMNQFGSATGKQEKELEQYEKVLKNIYKNNYGESFADIADAMATIHQQMGEMDDSALQQTAEDAITLRDVFGYEVTESVRAAKALMDNFGVSSQKAFQLITSGAQNGLDFSGELIDSINEYSVQFAKAGVSADQMFQIMQQGADAGAWNLDKVGDAIKELSIRIIDGSDTTTAGLEALGLNVGEISSRFAAGGTAAQAAFREIVQGLASMEDPVQQNLAGVNLFGTMWEDLGPQVVSQLAGISQQAYGTADALTQIQNMKYDDLGSVMEGLKRSFELAAEPLGEVLIPGIASIMDLVGKFAEALGETTETLAPAFDPLVSAFELLGQNAQLAFDAIVGGAAGLGAAAIVTKLGTLTQGITGISQALKLAGTSMLGTFGQLNIQLVALGAMITTFFGLAKELAQTWNTMSDAEKAVSVLGMIALAAGIAAVAFAALTGGAVGAIAAAAGIAAGVAGIVATMSAVNSAKGRTTIAGGGDGGYSAAPSAFYAAPQSVPVPRLATGAVIPPNGEFLAVLGDQKHGRNLEAPEDLIRQIVREETAGMVGADGGEIAVTINFTGSLSGLARYLAPKIEVAQKQRGSNLIKGGGAT